MTNPTVFAALAAVRQDKTYKRVNFEIYFVYLVVVCPVEEKLAKKGKVSFQAEIYVATATAPGLGGESKKPGFGTSGVSLCYHKHKDFVKLPKDQKDDLAKGQLQQEQWRRKAQAHCGKEWPLKEIQEHDFFI